MFSVFLLVALSQNPALAPAQSLVPDAGAPPAAAPAAPSAPAAVLPYKEDIRTLKNGLKVVMINTGHSGLMAYVTLVRAGARNEVEEGRTGFAHFFEHMMFRGTDAYPADKRTQMLNAAGVDSNAFTEDDDTVFVNSGPTEALPTLITLEADRFQSLKYTKAVFQTEAKAVFGEYNKDVAHPDFGVDEAMRKAAFQKSTYRHSAMGFLKDIKRMPDEYAYSQQFFKRWYVPGNATIFVIGDFAPDATYAAIEKAYGGWAGTPATVKIPVEPEHKSKSSVTLRWPGQSLPRVAIGYHAPSLGSDVKAAAIQNVLGPYLFGQASALYRSLVLDQHLVEGFDNWYHDHREPFLFWNVATVKDEGSLQAVQDAMEKAVAELAAKGPDPKLLEDVKSNLRYGLLMNLEAPLEIGELLAVISAPTGDPASLDQLYQAQEAVTAADVQTFAQKYLTEKNEAVIVLRPAQAAAKGQP